MFKLLGPFFALGVLLPAWLLCCYHLCHSSIAIDQGLTKRIILHIVFFLRMVLTLATIACSMLFQQRAICRLKCRF